MSTVIYYFSGTGNSLFVARDLAQRMDARLISIPSMVDNDRIFVDADRVGIVFPVYNAVLEGLPLMVKQFVGKLENIESKYVFAVCTCKGWSRLTISHLNELIGNRGGKLSAGFTVPMPDNSNPITLQKQQKFDDNWKKKVVTINRYVTAKKRGRYEDTYFFNLLVIPFMKSGSNATFTLYNKLANTSNLPFEMLLPLSDRSFVVDENCNGCGICARVCPANDIEIVNEIPVWKNRCESCLACQNWCPQMAIKGGITIDRKPTGYHHPGVKVSEMFLR